MKERIGHVMEGLGAPLALAGTMMLIWNSDSRIALTLTVWAIFSIFIGAMLADDL